MNIRLKPKSFRENALARKKNNSRRSTIWAFLNSTFGMFLVSSVFLSFLTWGYSQWTHSREQRDDHNRRWEHLRTEMSYRARYVRKILMPLPSTQYKVVRGAVYGFESAANQNPSWVTHYSSIYPEYESRSLSSLAWEMESLNQLPSNKRTFESMKQQIYEVEGCFDSLEYHESSKNQRAVADEWYALNPDRLNACLYSLHALDSVAELKATK